MPGIEPRTASPRTAGLLDVDGQGRVLPPWSWLARLRPITVEAWFRWAQDYQRMVVGLKRIQAYFPETMSVYASVETASWYEILHHLSSLVEEAGWFPINWDALNEAWAVWMQDTEDDNGDCLARYLHYMPVALFGFTPGSLREYPPMELLYVLLAKDVEVVSERTATESGLYDTVMEWDDSDRQATWELLHTIEADPGRWPEAVRWLPALARWSCQEADNIFFNHHFDPYEGRGPWLTWDNDLEAINLAWRRAQSTVDMFHRLMAWYEKDSHNLSKLADFLIQGGPSDELDW